jgi:hypothetical protein
VKGKRVRKQKQVKFTKKMSVNELESFFGERSGSSCRVTVKIRLEDYFTKNPTLKHKGHRCKFVEVFKVDRRGFPKTPPLDAVNILSLLA